MHLLDNDSKRTRRMQTCMNEIVGKKEFNERNEKEKARNKEHICIIYV